MIGFIKKKLILFVEKNAALLDSIYKRAKRKEIRESMSKRGNVELQDSFDFEPPMRFSIHEDCDMVRLGTNVKCRMFCNFMVFQKASLFIGNNVFFNNACSINCLGRIDIDENTIFGEGVKIYDHNHNYYYNENKDLVIDRNQFKIGHVRIGRNCWIGSNVTILMNVEVGDNVIIGANSLIHKSIPSNSIVYSDAGLIITPKTT